MVKQTRSIKNKSTEPVDSSSKALNYANPYQKLLEKKKPVATQSSFGFKKWIIIASVILIGLLLSGVFSPSVNQPEIPNANNNGEDQLNHENADRISAVLYSSPTCGCCHNYVAYLNENGFDVFQKRTEDYQIIKDEHHIPSEQRSCHTVIIGDYFVEGHIPVTVVYNMLELKPSIDGIALPEMPSGTPGMDGEKDSTWTISSILNGQVVDTFATV